jgi:hypothetical protein
MLRKKDKRATSAAILDPVNFAGGLGMPRISVGNHTASEFR